MTVDDVLSMLTVEQRATWAGSEDSIRQSARYLVWRAVQESIQMLDEGSPRVRMSVIKALAPRIGRWMGDDSDTEIEELRRDFFALLADLRGEQTE